MLSNTLVTNEVKDAAGTEVEFQRLGTEGRTTEFAKVSEAPNAEYRLKVSHLESGSGSALRRRSVVRIDKTITGVSLLPRTVSAYLVLDAPVGDISSSTEMKNVIANVLSFCATTGAATTVLFDCTGSGASVLIDGSL